MGNFTVGINYSGTPFSSVFSGAGFYGFESGNQDITGVTVFGSGSTFAFDLDNFTFRAEYYSDMNGQRTGVKADYANFAMGWQHWLSPSVVIRPEVAWYNTVNGVDAFGRDNVGVPRQNSIAVFSVDTIIRF